MQTPRRRGSGNRDPRDLTASVTRLRTAAGTLTDTAFGRAVANRVVVRSRRAGSPVRIVEVWGLPNKIAAGRSQVMIRIYDETIPLHDEGLARASDVGSRAHHTIGLLAARSTRPSRKEQERIVAGQLAAFRPMEQRAHRQNLLAAVGSYFTHLSLPDQWQFHGAENRVGTGRVDLIWCDLEGRILLDEIKTGNPRTLALTRTRTQVFGYAAAAQVLWPHQFVGVRLLSTRDPATSQFITPDLQVTSLSTTHYRR